jgi:RNA polymerase sigma-70 factor (ECF subfamily)
VSIQREPFEEMMRPRIPLLYRYASARISDPHDANDIVQETMLAAWKGYDARNGQASVNAWLFGIVRNKIADYYRKRYRQPAERLDDSLPASDELSGVETRLDINGMLSGLSAGEYETVYLLLVAGLTYAETAQVLGIPEGTVKSRLHAVRKKMRSMKEQKANEH